jgi:hypothetical protein
MRFRSSLFRTMLPMLAATLFSAAPVMAQAHASHAATPGTALPLTRIGRGGQP